MKPAISHTHPGRDGWIQRPLATRYPRRPPCSARPSTTTAPQTNNEAAPTMSPLLRGRARGEERGNDSGGDRGRSRGRRPWSKAARPASAAWCRDSRDRGPFGHRRHDDVHDDEHGGQLPEDRCERASRHKAATPSGSSVSVTDRVASPASATASAAAFPISLRPPRRAAIDRADGEHAPSRLAKRKPATPRPMASITSLRFDSWPGAISRTGVLAASGAPGTSPAPGPDARSAPGTARPCRPWRPDRAHTSAAGA